MLCYFILSNYRNMLLVLLAEIIHFYFLFFLFIYFFYVKILFLLDYFFILLYCVGGLGFCYFYNLSLWKYSGQSMLIPLKLSGPIRFISLRIGMQVVIILCRSLLRAHYQVDIWTHLLFDHHQENITNQVP